MGKINIAVIGIGNCASSLIQGIHYYKTEQSQHINGLMHREIGGYRPEDINVCAAFDIDKRKVGKDVNRAIFEKPNCTKVFSPDIPDAGVSVRMGRVLDGVPGHMETYDEDKRFLVSSDREPVKEEVVKILKQTGTDILVNYLPVGSREATEFYVECALEAETGFINNIPVFIASDEKWAERFREKNLPLIGDDIKAQMGATIIHRTLTDLFSKRGVFLNRTYQLNTGGNTDFLNMLAEDRLAEKRRSKTDAVQSVSKNRLDKDDIHIGPSDYVPWQKDNKVCFLRMEGTIFGDVPMNLELRLSVEDSPNSAGVAIDAIRCCKIAHTRGRGGVINSPSSFFCKHPPKQYPDDQAWRMVDEFIEGRRED